MKRISGLISLKSKFISLIRHRKTLMFLFITLFTLSGTAQVSLNENAKISLLTASPWYGAVYAFFGHTAIHVQDDSTGVNIVYNYGIFDTSKPYFIYNFTRGKTDYILGISSLQSFIDEYKFRGQRVVEQELNLSHEEKQQLYNALFINELPENRGYRYNYFYENCTTRPRDLIEQYTNGTIQYPPTKPGQSYRDLVHECVESNPWLQFGIDLVIGGQADSTINLRSKMFLPAYLMDSFEGAVIQRNDTLRVPLVKNTNILLNADNKINIKAEKTQATPVWVAIALFFITVVISLFQVFKLNKTKLPLFFDTILFFMAGLAGVVIFVLMYFSEHPATNPNWNFVWLNPFALIAALLFRMKSANRVIYCYHFINFALLSLFLLSWWWIPQQMPLATIPFSMCLWLRSGMNNFLFRKKQIKNRQFTTSKYLKAGWGEL